MMNGSNNRTTFSVEVAGPYDGVAQDLWFLPDQDPSLDLAPDLAPLPRTERRLLIDPADWAAAEAACAGALAELALLYGSLEERLRAGPAGWRHRLALLEAAELSWAVGDRIQAERLGLWEALRLSAVQDDPQALARASWALRRLLGPPTGFAEFFGRQGGTGQVGSGQGWTGQVEGLAAMQRGLEGLHPVTRAVALAQGWRMLGEGGPTADIEAMVLAGVWAGRMGLAGGFVPQALSGSGAAQTGNPEARLALWLRGATAATRAALLHLERIAIWQDRATRGLADLQGRTPGLLLKVLAEWPMVTAPMAEELTHTNKATVLRNLARMQARGLLREVTGQGRYRVWTARL